MRLLEGGSIQKYYPLSDEGWEEYEAWKARTPVLLLRPPRA